jgi:hypothetical protein
MTDADDRRREKLERMAERGTPPERSIARRKLRRSGGKTKKTRRRLDALLVALRAGNTRESAALYAGIHKATFYRWMAASATLRDAVEKAEADAEVAAVATVRQAFGSNWQAAAWWLERRRALHYRRQDNVQLTGAEGGPIEHSVTQHLTLDQRRELQRALRRVLEESAAGDSALAEERTRMDA